MIWDLKKKRRRALEWYSRSPSLETSRIQNERLMLVMCDQQQYGSNFRKADKAFQPYTYLEHYVSKWLLEVSHFYKSIVFLNGNLHSVDTKEYRSTCCSLLSPRWASSLSKEFINSNRSIQVDALEHGSSKRNVGFDRTSSLHLFDTQLNRAIYVLYFKGMRLCWRIKNVMRNFVRKTTKSVFYTLILNTTSSTFTTTCSSH